MAKNVGEGLPKVKVVARIRVSNVRDNDRIEIKVGVQNKRQNF